MAFPKIVNQRSKARRLVLQMPAWRAGGEGPSRVWWFCTWWTVHSACPDRPHHLPWSGADLLLNVHETPSWATSRKEGMAWYSSRPMPSHWYVPYIVHLCTQWMYVRYDLIRGSSLMYIYKGPGQSSLCTLWYSKYLSCHCYFSLIPRGCILIFFRAQSILLACMCSPTGLFNFRGF